jgi:hypothetical protein
LYKGVVFAAIYYTLAILVTYPYFFVLFYISDSAIAGLAVSLLTVMVFTLTSFLMTRRISGKGWYLKSIGFRKKGLIESLLLASALSIFGPVAQLYTISTSGLNSLIQGLLGYPGSLYLILHSLPDSLLFFSMVGVLAFGFFQAFPYSLLNSVEDHLIIPLLVILWAVLYGAANIVMGTPLSLGDIGLFGVIFLLIYRHTGNSLGPILAYVLLAEEPAWVALAIMSPATYIISLYFKIMWSLVAAVAAIWWELRLRKVNRS